MSRLNKICKSCGKDFHNCEGCGTINEWEKSYCSQRCWNSSKEYIEYRLKFEILYKMAKKAEMHGDLLNLVSEEIMNNYDLYDIVMRIEE